MLPSILACLGFSVHFCSAKGIITRRFHPRRFSAATARVRPLFSCLHFTGSITFKTLLHYPDWWSYPCKLALLAPIRLGGAGVLQSDSCRMAQLRCHTAIEGHPFRGFSWGNRASLWDQPRAAGIPIRDRIVQYYRSASRHWLLKLAVVSMSCI